MRLDLYQAESERIANEQMALLAEAKQRIQSGAPLSRLEQSGVLHALQVLIENAIGKSKHLLKSAGMPVSLSQKCFAMSVTSFPKVATTANSPSSPNMTRTD